MQIQNGKGYDGLDWVKLVVDGGGGAGEVVDLVDLEEDGLDDVVADELEAGVGEVMHEVLLPAREEVVDDDDAVPAGEKLVYEVASDESGAASDHDSQGLLADADGEAARRRRVVGGGEDAGVSGDGGSGGGGAGGGGEGAWVRGEGRVEDEEGGGEEEAEEDEEEAVLADEVGCEGAGERGAVVRAMLLAGARLPVELLHCRRAAVAADPLAGGSGGGSSESEVGAG